MVALRALGSTRSLCAESASDSPPLWYFWAGFHRGLQDLDLYDLSHTSSAIVSALVQKHTSEGLCLEGRKPCIPLEVHACRAWLVVHLLLCFYAAPSLACCSCRPLLYPLLHTRRGPLRAIGVRSGRPLSPLTLLSGAWARASNALFCSLRCVGSRHHASLEAPPDSGSAPTPFRN